MKTFSHSKAQSTIEFTFAMIVTMFLIYGVVQVFRWTGMDLANRRIGQDSSLTVKVQKDAKNPNGDPEVQLNSSDDTVLPMAAVYHGEVSNGNTSQ